VPSVVNDYRNAMKRHAPGDELSFSSLEGYLNARLLVESLRLAGRKLDAEGIVDALETAGSIDLGGFRVNYSRTARVGSSFVDTVFSKGDGRFRSH
jgi:hypothetical protein